MNGWRLYGKRGRSTWLLAAAMALLSPVALSSERLDEIETRLRGKPDEALQALQGEIPRTNGVERVQALVLRGWLQVRVTDADGVEQTAQALENGGDPAQQALATSAAAMVRGRWLARHGSLGRADRLLAEAAARLPATAPADLRLRLLDTQAKVKQGLGKLDEAVRLYQESVALADRSGLVWRRSEQRSALAYTLYLAQQYERAQDVNREAIALAVQAGDLVARVGAMNTEGMVAGALGHKTEELQAMRAAIELARQAGATRDTVLAMANLSDYYLKLGDYGTALDIAREALPMARQVKDPVSESVALANAGLALILLRQTDEGTRLVREALMVEERAGALTQMSVIQEELGLALEKSGHHREAWAALAEHRRLAEEVFRREQQQAVLELQEAFDADRRSREVALLQTEMGLKEEQLVGRDLQQRLWAVGVLAGALLLAVVGLLVGRMRRSNAALTHSNAELKLVSERDPLTGLANRRHLQQVMQRDDANGGQGLDGALLLIDIDHFKRINDQHGHAAGDAVLVEMAQRLRDALREDDLTVRWGGEEFLVLVRGLPPEQVETLAQRLLTAIGGRPVLHGTERIAVTASIGFATFPLLPLRAPTGWERAIDLVDTAMYLAKAHGRNRAYGVRSMDGAGAPAGLENAWRNGQAELTQLPGPKPVEDLS
jgi:diguanylate cyclase (GGDEF)-like protein